MHKSPTTGAASTLTGQDQDQGQNQDQDQDQAQEPHKPQEPGGAGRFCVDGPWWL
jgi:hypothetical protein